MNPPPFQVTDLGRMAYPQALEVQRATHRRVLDGLCPPTVLLVEHDPVITVSRRRGAAGHVLADAPHLAQLGIAVQPTDRGGDVTYHGPGQLVAYPILNLHNLGLSIGSYMRLLEQVAIDTAAAFGVTACRDAGFTGAWVTGPGLPPRKLCALGVRVSRGVTMHGLAFNVTTDLSHYRTIVPCGLPDRGVTSLADLLGASVPAMAVVKQTLVAALARQIGNLPTHTTCSS
jgi:lipoyl(octanoyl) transferase